MICPFQVSDYRLEFLCLQRKFGWLCEKFLHSRLFLRNRANFHCVFLKRSPSRQMQRVLSACGVKQSEKIIEKVFGKINEVNKKG